MENVVIGSGIVLVIFVLSRLLILPKLKLPSFIIALQIVFQFLLGEFDFGPASMRIYNLIFLVALLVLHHLATHTPLFVSRRSALLMYLGTCYVIWFTVSSLHRGDSTESTLYSIASVYLYSVTLFLVLQYFVRDLDDIVFCTFILIGVCLINGIYSIGQWQGYDWAWNGYYSLLPQTQMKRQEMLAMGISHEGYTPGLQGFSIGLSYVAMLGLCISGYLLQYFRKPFSWQAFFCVAVILLSEFSIVAALSRSSLIIFNILLVAGVIIAGPIVYGRHRRLIYLATCMILIGLVYVFAVVLPQYDVQGYQGFTTARLLDRSSTGRLDLWSFALDSIFTYPLFGIGAEGFARESASNTGPHNIFLNGGVYAGIPGLLLICSIFFIVILDCIRSIFAQRAARYVNPLSLGLALSTLGYCFKGLVHNDSFATGGIQGWLLMGLTYAHFSLKASDGSVRISAQRNPRMTAQPVTNVSRTYGT